MFLHSNEVIQWKKCWTNQKKTNDWWVLVWGHCSKNKNNRFTFIFFSFWLSLLFFWPFERYFIFEIFFEVVFWAFFNFRRVYTGQYYVPASQNWFGERYGINWKKSQFFLLLHTCGTTYDQQSEIVDFLLNFDVSENFRYVPDVCK